MKPEIRKHIEEEFREACYVYGDTNLFRVVDLMHVCLRAFSRAEVISVEEFCMALKNLSEWYNFEITREKL